MTDLTALTAREAVDLLKKKEVSPLELIDAAETRIAAVEPAVNALPTLCLERARRAARAIMDDSSERPPHHLHGLPIAVKDLQPVAGVRTTWCSRIYADHVPERSDICVEILEANGAVVAAKSNTPEFGAGANTFNDVFGKTLNPWDTRMSCGGSSGGSAVALATGEIWLATGSDLGGSLRIPGSFCSIVGFRPSPGRVACGPGAMPFDTLPVNGPMGRTVGDVALMLDAWVGLHPEDPRSLPRPARPFVRAADEPVRPKRIAYSPDLGLAPVDPEVREICARAARRFEELGCTVEEAGPALHDALEIFQTLRAARFAARFAPLLEKHRELFKPEIIWNIEKGLEASGPDVARAEMAHGALYHRTAAFFRDYDLLLCPAVITPPFEVETRYLPEFMGVEFDSYIDWLILTLAITLTACPSVSVPAGFTAAGLPVGLQMVAPIRAEDELLGAAALFEEMAGLAGHTPMMPKSP